jgi:hypothetical protein
MAAGHCARYTTAVVSASGRIVVHSGGIVCPAQNQAFFGVSCIWKSAKQMVKIFAKARMRRQNPHPLSFLHKQTASVSESSKEREETPHEVRKTVSARKDREP